MIAAEGEIELNAGRAPRVLRVLNTGDHPASRCRSHAHFFEVNRALSFDRAAAFGMRLDRPSGGGERFDPGIEKEVTLVPYGGLQVVQLCRADRGPGRGRARGRDGPRTGEGYLG